MSTADDLNHKRFVLVCKRVASSVWRISICIDHFDSDLQRFPRRRCPFSYYAAKISLYAAIAQARRIPCVLLWDFTAVTYNKNARIVEIGICIGQAVHSCFHFRDIAAIDFAIYIVILVMCDKDLAGRCRILSGNQCHAVPRRTIWMITYMLNKLSVQHSDSSHCIL